MFENLKETGKKYGIDLTLTLLQLQANLLGGVTNGNEKEVFVRAAFWLAVEEFTVLSELSKKQCLQCGESLGDPCNTILNDVCTHCKGLLNLYSRMWDEVLSYKRKNMQEFYNKRSKDKLVKKVKYPEVSYIMVKIMILEASLKNLKIEEAIIDFLKK